MRIKTFLATLAVASLFSSAAALANPSVQVGFSPEGSARTLVLNTINGAQHTIRMSGYSFTAADIAKALANAERRGVDVKIILDAKGNRSRYSKAAMNVVTNAGAGVRTTDTYKIHHDKILIVDSNKVETGSFNYTKAAEESNSENAVVLQEMPGVADIYLQHWASRWETGKDWHSMY